MDHHDDQYDGIERSTSPRSSTVSDQNKSTLWKKQSLVGKIWEIYWTPPSTQNSEKIIPSIPDDDSKRPPSPASTDVEEESTFDSDWYDAHVQSYLAEKDMFEVSFVGEENKVHLMKLEQKIVRPLEATSLEYYCPRSDEDDDHAYEITKERLPQHQIDLGWKDFLMGKGVEVFWESASTLTSTAVGNDEDDGFTSDWYDARIESFNSQTGLFQVSFVGEKIRYDMTLSQANVRPSARAWVNRAKFLLDLRTDTVFGIDKEVISCREMINMLPHSTECYGFKNNISDAEFCKSGDQPFTVTLYQYLLRDQLNLQKELLFAPLEEESDNSKRKYITPNSRDHVDHLTECVQLALDVSMWFEHNERFSPEGITRLCQKLDLQEIHSHMFNGFTLFLRTLVFHCDEKTIAKKSKRMHVPSPHSSASTSSKRAKKRRLSVYGNPAFSRENGDLIDLEYLASEVAHCTHLGEGWIEILKYVNTRMPGNGQSSATLSSEMVQFLLRQFSIEQSPRYLSWQLSFSLQGVLNQVWGRIETWMRDVKLAVGERYAEAIPVMGQFQCNEIDFTNKRCSSDAIHICIKESQHQNLLQKVNLDKIMKWLLQIEGEIVAFQAKAWETIAKGLTVIALLEDENRMANDRSRENLEKGDIVLTQLLALTQEKSCPRESIAVQNVHPLTVKTIEIAIARRKWVIFDKHIRINRERVKSLEEAYCQRPTESLQIPGIYLGLVKYFLCNPSTGEYITDLMARAQNAMPINWDNIQSASDCHKVIGHMINERILLEDEERAAVLSDEFAWSDRATELLGQDHARKVDFQSIEMLYTELQSLKKGYSKTRLVASKGLLREPTVDISISIFAKQQMFLRFGDTELQVTECYTKGSAWRKKANQILRTLNYYGNTNVHVSSNVSTKVNNMIELMVIEDLVKEHEENLFNFPEHAAALSKVSNASFIWVQACLDLLPPASIHPLDPHAILNSLREHSSHRPKGIVMFPSRQLVSEWIELLDWYCQGSLAFDVLRTCHEKKASASGEMTEENSILVQIVNTNSKVEELLLKGIDIISAPLSKENTSTSCSFEVDVSMLKDTLKVHCIETITPISLAKIYQHLQSTSLFSALKAHDGTLEHRGTFFLFELFVWKHGASDILSKVEKFACRRGKNHSVPSLEEAKVVLQMLHNLPYSFEDLSTKDYLLASVYSTKYSPLNELIDDTEKVNTELSAVLHEMNSPNLLITKEYIEIASAMLKNARSSVKTANGNGLAIDSIKASAVEKYIRDFNWLKSTFACPVLRDAKYSSSRRGVNTSDASFEAFFLDESRISLSLFLQIYEKATTRCRSGEALTSLDSEMKSMWDRISIIKHQISQWQAEVHTYIPQALRLSSRRMNKSRSLIDEECDIVSETALHKFLQHPILRYILMPEEDVIKEALAFTKSMAERMMVIFGRDHYGKDVDRSAIPQYASLLGNTGQFYLFRVFKSSEYLELKAELEGMECYSNSLPVKTLDKVTYSWITKVVKWIENVANAAVTPDSPNSALVQSCIPLKESIDLINEGQHIFLELPEESKKYLLDLKLSVNIRPSTGNIHVRNCKGGSNHSIGCTVLKWIAFCYNGLRNDLASTEFWIKRVDAALGQKKVSHDIATLESFLEEARKHLVIAPDDNVLARLVNSIDECSPTPSNEETIVNSEITPMFEHNLLK